jgi:hypothetical protein
MRIVAKRSLFFSMILVASALLCACGSGITSGFVRTGDYDKYRVMPNGSAWRGPPRIYPAPPHRPYVVVGLIEVRSSRPKPFDVLLQELSNRGEELNADAIIPGERPRTAETIAAGAGSFRAYYVFDDGRSQVLEARAIRFPN